MEGKVMKVHVITHTHWDREWYATFELFRQRLIEVIDILLDNIEENQNFKFFTLDGQTVVLEDYLELYPERKDKLVNLIKKGKIIVGPWYTLPDEFLIMGESLIRNYLYSKRLLNLLGVDGMNIGYLPDMFGHNAYTPVILKGLGFKAGVVWRGVGSKSRKTEFYWEAPNGDGIPTINLIHSYSNGAHLGGSIEKLKEKFEKEIESLKDHAITRNILIMNGTDHEMPIIELPEKFNEWSKEFGVEIIHSNLENYIDEVLKENPNLERVKGELREPKYEPVLKDVTSTRIYLKVLNFSSQLLYLKYLEPLSCIAKILGINSRNNEIDYGWKNILKSHPHDSICGCSIDRVHRDVEARLYASIEIGIGVLVKLIDNIISKIGEESKELNIIVYNPLDKEGKRLVELYLNLDSPNFELYDQKGNLIESYIEPIGIISNEYFDIIGKTKYMLMNQIRGFLMDKRPGQRLMLPTFKLSFIADLPPLSLTSFVLRKKEGIVKKEEKNLNLNFENNFYRFNLNKDGSFNLYDKIRGIEIKNINYFEDQGDIGDEYNFSPTEENPIRVIPEIKSIDVKDKIFLKLIIIKGDISLPAYAEERKRSSEKISMPFIMTYTLYRDFPRIDVTLEIENRAKDHRLRFGIDLPEEIDKVFNDGYYGIVEHDTRVENREEYVEENVPRYAMESFVVLLGEKFKMMITTQGLHEYEVKRKENETSLKITLLRSVGYLSRGDLKTRKRHAGPYLPTPEAQCIGKYKLDYSFIMLNSDKEKEFYEKSRDYLLYPVAIASPLKIKEWRLMEIPEELFLTTLKISEDNKDIIGRFVNMGENGIYNIKSKFFRKAMINNLREEYLEDLDGEEEWKIYFKKGEVKTIRFQK